MNNLSLLKYKGHVIDDTSKCSYIDMVDISGKGDIVPVIRYRALSSYKDIIHGFSTRLGGVSREHLASMNLSFSRGDVEENVLENHRRFAKAVGYNSERLVFDIIKVVCYSNIQCLRSSWSEMSRSIYSKKKKNSGFGMMYLISFLFIVLLSFVLATIWQQAEDAANGIVSSSSSESSTSDSSSEEEQSSDNTEHQADTSVQSSESTPIDYASFTLVPELERVTSEYFNNAVFIGDSITEGIKTYGLMSNSTVIAATGINISTITTNQVVKTANGRVTVLDALKQYPDTQKIYILLGANGIAWIEKDLFIHLYTEFIGAVKNEFPEGKSCQKYNSFLIFL